MNVTAPSTSPPPREEDHAGENPGRLASFAGPADHVGDVLLIFLRVGEFLKGRDLGIHVLEAAIPS